MHQASQVEIAQLIKTMQVGDYAPSTIKNYIIPILYINLSQDVKLFFVKSVAIGMVKKNK